MTEANNAPKAPPRLAFMDAVEAAAVLHTDRLTVLDYIKQGKLKTFGGKPTNPFLRTEQVERLAAELQVDQAAPVNPKTVHLADPVRKLRLRIQQDAKWNEIDENAMRNWAAETDNISFGKMRQVANQAISQLQLLIQVIDEEQAKRAK